MRFADGLAALGGAGPGAARGGARTHAREPRRAPDPAIGRGRAVLTSLPHPSGGAGGPADDLEHALARSGGLWLAGIVPTWDPGEEREGAPWRAFYGAEHRRRIPLPLYPFQRERYWVEPDGRPGERRAASGPAVPVKTPDVGRWFYAPSWRRLPAAAPVDAAGRKLLVSRSARPSKQTSRPRLATRTGLQPVLVGPGTAFATTPDGFTVRPGHTEDYEALLAALRDAGRLPQAAAHLWSAVP